MFKKDPAVKNKISFYSKDLQKITFYNKVENLEYKQQFQISNPVHLITYQNENDNTNFLTQKIKLELIRKNKPNKVLFDLSKDLYENLIISFLKHIGSNYNFFSQSILLDSNQNLYLDDENYLLLTFYGTVRSDSLIPNFSIKLNHLFSTGNKPISILKSKLESDYFDTLNYKYLYLDDVIDIKSIESVREIKTIDNNFHWKKMFLYTDYFQNTETKILTLYEKQKIKINTDSDNFYFYLIDC